MAAGAPAEAVIHAVPAQPTDRLYRYERRVPFGSPARLEPAGTVSVGALRWSAEWPGLPGAEVELRVRYRGRSVGGFRAGGRAGAAVPVERRIVAVTLAVQIGAALGETRSGPVIAPTGARQGAADRRGRKRVAC